MFAAIILTAMMLGQLIAEYGAFFTSVSLLVVVGMIDDSKDVSAAFKALAQFAGALIMTLWGGMVVVNLGTLVGSVNVSIPYTGLPFTVFCVVGLINALNMTDGADGLAGGVSLTALVWFLIAALLANRSTEAVVLSVFVAALIGFMVHNIRSPWRASASVFMGDAGSMMLGFALSWFAVSLSQGSQPAITPVTVLWILALPTIDALIVLVKRVASRRSPFEAGVDHLHHILQDRGYTVQQTVFFMVSTSALLGGIGVLGMGMGAPQGVMLALFLLLIAAHWLFVTNLSCGTAKRVAADRASATTELRPVIKGVEALSGDDQPSRSLSGGEPQIRVDGVSPGLQASRGLF